MLGSSVCGVGPSFVRRSEWLKRSQIAIDTDGAQENKSFHARFDSLSGQVQRPSHIHSPKGSQRVHTPVLHYMHPCRAMHHYVLTKQRSRYITQPLHTGNDMIF